ncbi:MAG: 4Fe-4S binding protein [Oligoflexia bacterium]|nr:4Fe-4S binding protein [Oligoflexia bacterium]
MKLNRSHIIFFEKHLRFLVQILFALLCIWIGWEFIQFVRYFESGASVHFHERPPGVDGFLPISSLMNLIYFCKAGSIHPIHPAGFFIFIAIILISFLFGKSFCSWFCFAGLLSEKLGDMGERVFKRKFYLPKFLDLILRSLKYFLLAFFLFYILPMSANALKAFLDGHYNMIADIKMYYFFANISTTAVVVITLLMFLSIPFRGFWCRYLCPYGALLGMVGLLSLFKIVRNQKSCIKCGLCTKVCPSQIKVDRVAPFVLSDECTFCLKCVDLCPVQQTLEVRPFCGKGLALSKRVVALAVIMLFTGVTAFGMLSGHWQNRITKEEYMVIYQLKDTLKHH